jgi:hypothetical protein
MDAISFHLWTLTLLLSLVLEMLPSEMEGLLMYGSYPLAKKATLWIRTGRWLFSISFFKPRRITGHYCTHYHLEPT